MQAFTVAVLAAIVAVAVASNYGCPHPNEAKHLLYERLAVAAANPNARHVEDIDISKEVLGRSDLSCITVVSRVKGATPDYISFGRNKANGYSIILHSRLRNPLNVTLYIYGQ